ncbi:ZYRO0E05434p [Zygosaccharomyces rouxii]|uniref:ZYRO0E05434p n=1 Tax=Zygosaccharomyces rouxii (strain ATCC 2623 / CBS 732 / NBRC 1130 / NCYC 568 / NRRL Y-229) TaxID=559307 RepID=C5E4F1_ZYGRC|nr:uncharacterized protein ZYRO0E05434g [Zygosaccharomyces rouxii]KAH9198230.1 nucleophile aminohydrolase [Zygosaccharomyces rouxii]CAR30912.1 ZYRO0E05434p [Zygosaccharomyces rouxii]
MQLALLTTQNFQLLQRSPMSYNSSRRSTVHSTKGIVASTQPLASAAGAKVLELGGNSVDACVAVAACLCVLEPPSTGIGGDCFMLHYDNNSKKVIGLNGTGRSPANLSRTDIIAENESLGRPDAKRMSMGSVHSVTVPGAVAGWVDAVEKCGSGKVTLSQILQPAIDLCEKGHPISKISSILTLNCWKKLNAVNSPELLECFAPVSQPLAPPKDGELVVNKPLGRILRSVAENGKDAFYDGDVARGIIGEVQHRGGLLTLDDLKNHASTLVEPIHMDFLGGRIWEIPPNSQGLVVLLALGIIKELQKSGTIDLYAMKHNSAEYLHLLIEALKLAFYDVDEYVGDPEFGGDGNLISLWLSEYYLKKRAAMFDSHRVIDGSKTTHGVPDPNVNQSDTVYFTASDPEGNATSFINSVYTGFGSAIIPRTLGGFCLHNRGANFNLLEGSRNCLEGSKRPYHTIIPALITDPETNELIYTLGNMGGFMQPTGHVQHFLNLMLFKLSPQESLDSPRICLSPHPDHTHLDRGRGAGGPVSSPVTLVEVEEDMDPTVVEQLRHLGHAVKVVRAHDRSVFGRGQIIKKTSAGDGFIYSAGTDKRGDGIPIPLI